jgi:hypothetical protein
MTARDLSAALLAAAPMALVVWDAAFGTRYTADAIRHLWWSVAVLGEAMRGWV